MRPSWTCSALVAVLAGLAWPATLPAQPADTSQPETARPTGPQSVPAPTTQPTPPGAAALLALIHQVAPGRTDARDPRAMTEYAVRVNHARAAMARLRKEYPEVADRPDVRIAELAILFDSSYLSSDLEMKQLRATIAGALADASAGRAVHAMAEYYLLNADVLALARKEPATQPDHMPAWVAGQMDRRVAFARKYKEQDIARQAFGEAVIYKVQADGYPKTIPLIAEFIDCFPAERLAQATLLAQIAVSEYARYRDGWVYARPIAERLMKEYRDQSVTPQVLAALAIRRIQSDAKGGLEMVEQLTTDFPGDEAVARAWRELALQAYSEKKSDVVAERLKVLSEKFPKSQARVEALATLAWLAYRQNGLEAVLPSVTELQTQFPNSPVIVRLCVVLAQSQIEKVGYEKAAGFVNSVLTKYAGTEDARQLEEYIRQYRAATSQPEGPPPPPVRPSQRDDRDGQRMGRRGERRAGFGPLLSPHPGLAKSVPSAGAGRWLDSVCPVPACRRIASRDLLREVRASAAAATLAHGAGCGARLG